MSAILFILFIVNLLCTSEAENSSLKCLEQNFTDIEQRYNTNEYCKTHKCIAKCCPAGKILSSEGCIDGVKDFSNITIYKKGIKNKKEISESIKITDFKLVYDAKFLKKHCSEYLSLSPIIHYILEDGSIQLKFDDNKSSWLDLYNPLEYCMEFLYYKSQPLTLVYHILDSIYTLDEETTTSISHITVGLTLTSCFFLFLTLIIYCLIPCMRNINGMIQMAYYAGLIVMFILRNVQDLRPSNSWCSYVAPFYYFVGISNFVWLAVMSFNLWWSFRGTLNHCMIHRKGENQKFCIYATCVYGSTSALTIFAVLVELYLDEEKYPNIWKPAFNSCLNTDGIIYYFYIPIAIMISTNCLLFIMTLYNIWKIRKGIEQFDASESRKNQASLNSFKIYKKISIMMGVSWILEIAQIHTNLPLVANIIVNLYNTLIGVIIFFVVITEKNTYRKLCARFNKNHKWGRSSEKPSTECSGYSRSSKKQETFQTITLNSMSKQSSDTLDRNSK